MVETLRSLLRCSRMFMALERKGSFRQEMCSAQVLAWKELTYYIPLV